MNVKLKARDLWPTDEIRVRVLRVERAGRNTVVLCDNGMRLEIGPHTDLDVRRVIRGPAGSGGEKGQAIIEAFAGRGEHGATVQEIADEVGCHPNRVYEVLRVTPELEQIRRGRYFYRGGSSRGRWTA